MHEYKYQAKDAEENDSKPEGQGHEHAIRPTGPSYPIGHSADKPALIEPRQPEREKKVDE